MQRYVLHCCKMKLFNLQHKHDYCMACNAVFFCVLETSHRILVCLYCHVRVFCLFLQDSEKRTPMHAAAYCGETECVVALARAGRPFAHPTPSHSALCILINPHNCLQILYQRHIGYGLSTVSNFLFLPFLSLFFSPSLPSLPLSPLSSLSPSQEAR